MFSILKPYIFSLDPEVAHDFAINSLKINVLPKSFFEVEGEELLETTLFEKKIPNYAKKYSAFQQNFICEHWNSCDNIRKYGKILKKFGNQVKRLL